MKQDLLDRVLKSPRLPSLPTIALEVIDLVQQRDVNIKQIAYTIQHDPALSSKILKTVNSSFYGQAYSVSTISHALVVLGLNSVKTLALGFSLVANLTNSGGESFDHFEFWKRSLYTATAAKNMAKQLGLVQQEEAFLGGLLQDLGMLALNQALGVEYAQLLEQAGREHRDLRGLEQKHLEMDHAEVGAALAEAWHLPPLLVAPIRYHECPDMAQGDLVPLVRCVALGNLIAAVFMSEFPGDALEAFHRRAKEWFNLSDQQDSPLLKSIHKETNEMRRLFDLPTGELGNPDDILMRANEALMHITLQSQQQTTELQQQNRQLAEQASTDSLTGIANRRRFNEFIAEQFQLAEREGSPLSVLFLDTDYFKKFNDTYGHATGDRVLIELAQILQNMVTEQGLVARYGGEEFAIVLPGTDRRQAAQLAEELRQRIAATIVESDEGQLLRITASIGVSCYSGAFFQRGEQLVKAADQAVYAAKAAGRNCVRIFTPKPKSTAAA
jgi:diguanylate cyclase (GGDEF)-like protein